MAWESASAFHAWLYVASLIAAVVLTLAVGRWSGRVWIGMLAGVLAPPAAVLLLFLYLESRAPVGPYFAILGLIYSVPSLLLALCGAALAAFLRSARD